jgi:hypothetical protein
MVVIGEHQKLASDTDLLMYAIVDVTLYHVLQQTLPLLQIFYFALQQTLVFSANSVYCVTADNWCLLQTIYHVSHQMPVSSRPFTLHHSRHWCLLQTLYLVPQHINVTCRPFPIYQKRVVTLMYHAHPLPCVTTYCHVQTPVCHKRVVTVMYPADPLPCALAGT